MPFDPGVRVVGTSIAYGREENTATEGPVAGREEWNRGVAGTDSSETGKKRNLAGKKQLHRRGNHRGKIYETRLRPED